MNDPLGIHVGGMGDDDELAQIRARRAAELRGRGGGAAGAGGFPGGMMPAGMQGMGQNPQSAEEQAQKQKAADEQRAQILKAILTPQARERLANIAMVKKDKARRIEDMLITQAHRGAIAGAIEEDQLISMLESINEMEGKSKVGKVTIQRKRIDDDDDW